jgi:predicted O-methyltransferase YrrM
MMQGLAGQVERNHGDGAEAISGPTAARNSSDCEIHTSTIRDMLFATNPYDGFNPDDYPLDLHGWGSQHPVFGKMIEEVSPRLVVEVGTWKGASAIHMARCLKERNLDTQIVCVDTWLGSLDFWDDKQDPQLYQSLQLKNGFPHVYYQFLANVAKSGFQQTIVPFPQTAEIAARWFRKHDVRPDLIYIDASHEEEDVFRDLHAYWEILAPGGIMFGDDYSQYWPGVRSAVRRFARFIGLAVVDEVDKWVVRKPAAWQPSIPVSGEAEIMHQAHTTRFEVISEQLSTLVHCAHDLQADTRARHQELLVKHQELLAKDQQLNTTIQDLQAELQDARARLNRWEGWHRRVMQSRVRRLVVRYATGRPSLPFDS